MKPWEQHEKDIVSLLGGRATKASGAGWYDRGDGKHSLNATFPLFWECKCTESESYNVGSKTWFKLEQQALGRIPVLFVRLHGREDFAVVDMGTADFLHVKVDSLERRRRASIAPGIAPCVVAVLTPFGMSKRLVVLSIDDFLKRYEGLGG